MGNKFGAGWLAHWKTSAPADVTDVGTGSMSASDFETAFPNAVVPLKGFSYVYQGSLLKFYEGVPKDVPFGLRVLLAADGGGVRASSTITIGGTATDADTLTTTINGFDSVSTVVDAQSPDDMAVDHATAINANTDVNTLVEAVASGATVVVSAILAGTAGNAITIAVSESGTTETIAVSGTPLTGGKNGGFIA